MVSMIPYHTTFERQSFTFHGRMDFLFLKKLLLIKKIKTGDVNLIQSDTKGSAEINQIGFA